MISTKRGVHAHLDEGSKSHILTANRTLWIVQSLDVPTLWGNNLLKVCACCNVGPKTRMATVCTQGSQIPQHQSQTAFRQRTGNAGLDGRPHEGIESWEGGGWGGGEVWGC